jgi:hypothetical protein
MLTRDWLLLLAGLFVSVWSAVVLDSYLLSFVFWVATVVFAIGRVCDGES